RRQHHQLGGRAARGTGCTSVQPAGAAAMMAQRKFEPDLIDRLPRVRGRIRANAPLAPFTWFRVGGPAEILFRPADVDDLAGFLADCPADIPVMVLGAASNLLIRDGGLSGIVI